MLLPYDGPARGGGEILEQGCCDAVFGNPECRALFERMEEEGGE